jgi:hypothetical protein
VLVTGRAASRSGVGVGSRAEECGDVDSACAASLDVGVVEAYAGGGRSGGEFPPTGVTGEQ